MARDDDGDRVVAVGEADGAHCSRFIEAFGNVAITACGTERDARQFFPDAELKFRASSVEGDLEGLPTFVKILTQLTFRRIEVQIIWVVHRAATSRFEMSEEQPGESVLGSEEHQGTNRAGDLPRAGDVWREIFHGTSIGQLEIKRNREARDTEFFLKFFFRPCDAVHPYI